MEILYKKEIYEIVGFCMEIRNVLGYGFSEVIYKDAMEQEFIDNSITYIREDELYVHYKGKILKHRFNTDFTVFENIVVEVKSWDDGIVEKTIPQILNYLKASGNKVGLIVNFGKARLEYKRLIV